MPLFSITEIKKSKAIGVEMFMDGNVKRLKMNTAGMDLR